MCSRTQPLPFPYKSPHTWQALTLGKQKNKPIFWMFSIEALTNNLGESHPTQLESNNTSPHPRMTSMHACHSREQDSRQLLAWSSQKWHQRCSTEPASGGHAPKRTKTPAHVLFGGKKTDKHGKRGSFVGIHCLIRQSGSRGLELLFSST